MLSYPHAEALDALPDAVHAEAAARLTELLSGIKRYQATDYTRDVEEPAVIWRHGAARLLDYTRSTRPWGATILFVPSLINRYYILDLAQKQSLARYIAQRGHSVQILDWGAPSKAEQYYDCAAYVKGPLMEALRFITDATRQPVVLAGYCMGGVLALAAAQLMPQQVRALALFATPWDFHTEDANVFRLEAPMLHELQMFIETHNALPPEWIQSLFYLSDPWLFQEKFRRYARLKPDSPEAHAFVALERWVNDGVPLVQGVAKECLIGWGQHNTLAHGQWCMDGQVIRPQTWEKCAFVAVPQEDRIVPPGCALALADQLSGEVVHCRPHAGHVGMMVGRRAKKELWEPFARWVESIA